MALRDAPSHTERLMVPGPPSELEPRAIAMASSSVAPARDIFSAACLAKARFARACSLPNPTRSSRVGTLSASTLRFDARRARLVPKSRRSH